MTVVVALLGLILLSVAGLVAYVVVVARQESGRQQRQQALQALARVQGIDVAVKVGQALGWVEDAKSSGDSIQIRVR